MSSGLFLFGCALLYGMVGDMWAPDVNEGAPTIMTALLAVMPK